MGPNALNVPFTEKGRVGAFPSFSLYTDAWFSDGDHTQDMGVHLYVPVVAGLVALEAWGVGLEHYVMTQQLAVERRVRDEQATGTASGDAYFAAVVSLVRNRKFPDMAFRFVLRTASGGELSDARYTDAPGYYFDLSAGKNFQLGQRKKNYLRGYGMLGFYSWQMNLPLYRQDDAVLFGVGGDLHIRKNIFSTSVAGYWGYLGKTKMIIVNPLKPVSYRDQPVVWRFSYVHDWENLKLALQLQGGIHDNIYKSVRLTITYVLPALFSAQNKSN